MKGARKCSPNGDCVPLLDLTHLVGVPGGGKNVTEEHPLLVGALLRDLSRFMSAAGHISSRGNTARILGSFERVLSPCVAPHFPGPFLRSLQQEYIFDVINASQAPRPDEFVP